MELSWKQSEIELEASAAHHGSPMRWSWTYGSGGWVEQRRLGSTVDDRAGTSALQTLHFCKNRVGSKRMRALISEQCITGQRVTHHANTTEVEETNLWKFGDVIPHRQFLVKEKTEIPCDRIRHHRGRDVGERHSATFPELLPSAEP